ncbi:LLM class flavin-dependent oxidoreductase [Streptomyces sp. NPDC052721]|uniref:LLM class flavin-dependent oxidoreductase n=1 Tax=Streptomyces sp. NPDC052721 TaxID=3154955 RepID=UPI003446995C
MSALAARTQRLRLGLLVTSNRIRPPAVLGKIATTIDAISWGRLIMGLGVGGTVQPPDAGGVTGENPAAAEYAAYGLTLVPPGEGIARMEETIAILRGMWTRDVFDFQGRYYTGPAPPDRGLGQPNAPPGRRARRHPEHPRTAAQHTGLHHRAQRRPGRPLRRHRP